ncbi:DUF2490 domain-containing protein [Dyadobacter sediminis]|uniref:DUF2490 domain-containing protein n=1 Tax=Dyadobacter sediminis TaxID=1493691 RepID=A0A5R9KE01_9BACT|nr:DUF2490 domain-containing protein [Dyadobacter sediminis]
MKFRFVRPYLICCFLLFFHYSKAQSIEHNGWVFWSHEQKLAEKWQFSYDMQLRSADRFDYANTLLIRPGIGYKIRENQTVTLGYTYFGTWEKEDDKLEYEPENRIFEQFEIRNKFKNIPVTNRFRFEQRFMHMQQEKIFAQRIRYYIQALIPVAANPDFTKGIYVCLQNELFLNVQGNEQSGRRFFDQNRPYAGTGYRFNKKLDLEAGYMLRYIIQEDKNVRNNIFQLSIKSSF